MSQAEIAQVVALFAVAVATAAVVLVALVYRRLEAVKKDQKVILGPKGVSGDIVAYVGGLSVRIDRLRDSLETLSVDMRDHEVRIDGCLSRVGVVRFDAYQDLGGRQSTAIGLLNAKDDGLVITTMVSRDFARTYIKVIKGGVSDVRLAPEEEEALQQARSNAPFTIRPRPTPADQEAVEKAAATPLVESTDEDLLPPEEQLGWAAFESKPQASEESGRLEHL